MFHLFFFPWSVSQHPNNRKLGFFFSQSLLILCLFFFFWGGGGGGGGEFDFKFYGSMNFFSHCDQILKKKKKKSQDQHSIII